MGYANRWDDVCVRLLTFHPSARFNSRMLLTAAAFLVAFSAVAIYLDASHYRIGRVDGDPSLTNISAGEWGFAVLALWIVAFPAYLIARSRLIARAEEHPRESDGRPAKAAALGAAGGLLVWVSTGFGGLPACDAPEVTSLLRTIAGRSAPGVDVHFGSYGEVAAETTSDRRMCRCEIDMGEASTWIRYSVEPHEGGQIFVRVLGP